LKAPSVASADFKDKKYTVLYDMVPSTINMKYFELPADSVDAVKGAKEMFTVTSK